MINERNNLQTAQPINLSRETRKLIAYDILVENIGSVACKDKDTEIFFGYTVDTIKQAKIICDECEIKDKCLDFAVINGEDYGVWGGTTPNERFRIAHGKRIV